MTSGLGALESPAALARGRAEARARRGWTLLLGALMLADGLALLSAFGLAYLLRFKAELPVFQEVPYSREFYGGVVFWALPVWLGILLLGRLYDRRYLFTGFQEYGRAAAACTVGALAVIVISYFYDLPAISRGWLLLVWALAILMIWGARFVARRAVRWLHRQGWLITRSVIVGANEEALALAEQLAADPGSGVQVLGFVAAAPRDGGPPGGLPLLGGLDDLGQLVEQHGVNEIVVSTTALQREELLDLYRRFGHDARLELRLSSGLVEILSTPVRVQEIGGVPLITPQRVRITGVDAVLKTLLDYAGALLGLLVLGPLLLLIGLAIKLDTGGPVIYRRRVLGRSGRPFDAFKFCTMLPDRRSGRDRRAVPRPGSVDRRKSDKSAHDPRITRVGRVLRRTSLDELPQLVNVLRGEMSLIGPRMITAEEALRYGKWQLNLLTVKPGLTGPWQVQGRGEIPYDERVRLSMEYIRDYSIWLDLEILLRTIPVVLGGKGAF